MAWQSDIANEQILLVKDDDSPLARPTNAIWVVTAGTVKWDDNARGTKHTHAYTLAAGFYPIAVNKLYATGTSAVILGLYD